MKQTDTPKTDELLGKILDKHGELHEGNAPESLVKLACKLERELIASVTREIMANDRCLAMCKLNELLKERAAAMPNAAEMNHGEEKKP